MEESWPVGTEHVPVENRTRARARIRGLSRSRYSIVVRFDIFSGHVDPPRGQTSFRADVLMTSISPFSLFLHFLAKSVVDRQRFSIERDQRSRNETSTGRRKTQLEIAIDSTIG